SVCGVCVQADTCIVVFFFLFFFSSRRRHTRSKRDWSSDVCSSDLDTTPVLLRAHPPRGTLVRCLVRSEQVFGGRVIEGPRALGRSEERRVGKECRSRWGPDE